MTQKRLFQTSFILLSSTLLLACGGGSGGSTTTPPPSTPKVESPSIRWSACANNASMQCGTLSVPMDHKNPEGKKITLGLRRVAAQNSSARQGSLLFNPGGPGGSGLEMFDDPNFFSNIPTEVRARFDLVAFDPRGVAASTPVDCSDVRSEPSTGYPGNRDDLQSIANTVADNAKRCQEKVGEYLQYLGSNAVVQDMDLIRRALGDATLNFIGYSYGTRLAGLYAQRYPGNTGRLILDASMHPNKGLLKIAEDDVIAMQKNLDYLAQQCASVVAGCTASDFGQRLNNRVNTLKSGAQNEEEFGLLGNLLQQISSNPKVATFVASAFWTYLQTPTMANLESVEQSLSAVASDQGTSPGAWATASYDEDTLFAAVMCADHAERPTVDNVEALRATFDGHSDIAAEIQLGSVPLMCSGWPKALDPIPAIETSNAPKTLVVGGDYDAATPYAWAVAMANALNGQLLKSEHLGHTVIFNGESQCSDNLAKDFLLTGTLADTAVCPVD